MNRLRLTTLLLTLSAALTTFAQTPESWTEPVEPIRVVGNIFYVGTAGLGSFLLVGNDGAILLDAPLDENTPLILRNIEKVGVAPRSVKILLNSHAHSDHGGGLASMRQATGARLHLSAPDAELAARGGRADFAFGDTLVYPPVRADAIVKDGETIRLGNLSMTAMITPGHTRGCTNWRTTAVEQGRKLDVLFLCSVTAPGYQLVRNEKYPQIVNDYRRTFERLAKLKPDVFLANHGEFFGLAAKREGIGTATNPFIDRREFKTFLANAKVNFEKELAKQKKAAGTGK